jgi:hypothetical protein
VPDTEKEEEEEEEDYGLRSLLEEQMSLTDATETNRAKKKNEQMNDQRLTILKAFVKDLHRHHLLIGPYNSFSEGEAAKHLLKMRQLNQATVMAEVAHLQTLAESERTHVYGALLANRNDSEEQQQVATALISHGEASTSSSSNRSHIKPERSTTNVQKATAESSHQRSRDVKVNSSQALLMRLVVLHELTSQQLKLVDEKDEGLAIWIEILSLMKKAKSRQSLYSVLTKLTGVDTTLATNFVSLINFHPELGAEGAQVKSIVKTAQRLLELVTRVPAMQILKAVRERSNYEVELPFLVLEVLSCVPEVADLGRLPTAIVNVLRQFHGTDDEKYRQLLWYFFHNASEQVYDRTSNGVQVLTLPLESLLHMLGNLFIVRQLDGVKYTMVHELFAAILDDSPEGCVELVDLIRHTQPRPSMINRFFVNILFAVQKHEEALPLLRQWLLVLRELNAELGVFFFNADGSFVDTDEQISREKKQVVDVEHAHSRTDENSEDGLETILDDSEDPREEALIYCWLFPTGDYRRRFYALIHRFGLSSEQVHMLYKL